MRLIIFFLTLAILISLAGCGPGMSPELQKEVQTKTQAKPKVEPEAKSTPEAEKKQDETDPTRLKTLEDKVNFIMDLVVKDVACANKRKAAQPALKSCQDKCDQDFPEQESQDDPPPALVNGQCVQVKLAHPPENKQNRECNNGCWEEFRKSADCE